MAGTRFGDIGGSPPWLATMREITGMQEYAGGSDNPVILKWARFIGEKYPEMRSYCAQYNHDAIAWCGLTVAYCMAKNGIRPVFGKSETERFSVGRRVAQIRSSPRQAEARLRDGLHPWRRRPCGAL